MIEQDFGMIAEQLANLASDKIDFEKRNYLKLIINKLFLDIANGHSCSIFNEEDLNLTNSFVIKLLKSSNLACVYETYPNVLDTSPISIIKTKERSIFYISKYLQYELNIAKKIQILSKKTITHKNPNINKYMQKLSELKQLTDLPNLNQFAAIQNSLDNKISFITGGPGTGKTTTVTLLLWILYQIYDEDIVIKICAPTGKAASRVKGSILSNIDFFRQNQYTLDLTVLNKLLASNNSFGTIHKLLGFKKNSIYFKHGIDNPLNIDVLIVDESSMISLPLFSKLLDAINLETISHVIFLGDKNQLSSVEEGFVFASLIDGLILNQRDLFNDRLSSIVNELVISKRNAGEISLLTKYILDNNFDNILQLMASSKSIKLIPPKLENILNHVFNSIYLNDYIKYASIKDLGLLNVENLFKLFISQTILCLTNVGILGSVNINLQIEKFVKQKIGTVETWYPGRPVIITENDYLLGLNNGDIGICIYDNDVPKIIFEDMRIFIPEILPKYQLAYALTIHKSQGSEYHHVNVVMPKIDENKICSRELLYTAVSRSKNSITLFTTPEMIQYTIQKNTNRNSGLSYFLKENQ